MPITINVTFTGICVFVEHQQAATVIIPNASGIRAVNHGGMHAHVASHLPFVEFDSGQPGISAKVHPLFSHRYKMKMYDVFPRYGEELQFVQVDGGAFTPAPPLLSWNDVVDMDEVVGNGYPIDDSLISHYDPRADRVAVRMPIPHGVIAPKPCTEVFEMFMPQGDRPYSRAFVQEVVWTVTYQGNHCVLTRRPFGNAGADRLVIFDGTQGTSFEITIGNAPIEDILRTGTGPREVVDHHFAIYYDLLSGTPPVMRLPHRTSEKKHQARTGAANCPPAKMTLR